MPKRSFPRLHVTRDLPRRSDALEFPASPPLESGEFVYEWTGPIRGVVPTGHVPVTLEPGSGPWFPVPSDAIEEC